MSVSATPFPAHQQHTNATACVRLGLAQVSLSQSFACLFDHWPRVVMCCVGARCVRECDHGRAVVMSDAGEDNTLHNSVAVYISQTVVCARSAMHGRRSQRILTGRQSCICVSAYLSARGSCHALFL